MILKKPKPIDRTQDLLDKAAKSDDYEVRDKATQYIIDQVAERCETSQDLYQFLSAIPDPEQRYIVLDRVKPQLKLNTEGLTFEELYEEIN